MFVTDEAKTTGDHYDEELGLYLDVDAIFQGEPFWWVYDPERYAAMKAARKSAGIEYEDDLLTDPEAQEGLQDGLQDDEDDDE